MAFPSAFTSQTSTLDSDHKLFRTDSIFDDPIDSEGPFSPTSTERKDSFATTTATLFSPQSSVSNWDDFPLPSSATLAERHMTMGNHFTETPMRNNPFHQHMSQPQWYKPAIAPSTYEHYPDHFDGSTSLSNYSGPTTFNGLSGHMNDAVRPAAIMPPSTGVPQSLSTSPMALAEQEIESQRLTKRNRPHSPHGNSHSSYLRQDGVRKKNARFDIPMERNLANIDELISKASNEDEKKELKQQKRLLRNRQAALDSRQRKKKHTEDLEEEKKAWTERHTQIERDNEELTLRFEALSVNYENLRQAAHSLELQVQGLENEKEELINRNILETGELRRKITAMREQFDSSPASHPTEYTDFTTELENLNMGPDGDWSTWVDYTDVESDAKPTAMETTVVVGQTRKDTHMSDIPEEKPSVGGKVLQLFTLVGALIAARPTTAPPTMSAEYQAEGQAIVEHVLNANPGLQQASMALLPGSNIHWPQPSNTQGQAAPAFSPQANAAGSSALTRRVLGQTKQQMAEAAFSMTAAQYQSMTNADFSRRSYENSEDRSSAPVRKSLSELVRANREATQDGGNTGEVYTRSLMWDRIPADVVQEFKRLVTENNDVKGEYDD